MYIYVWSYDVRPGREAEFERAYGPDGEWLALFRHAAGHRTTRLARDPDRPGGYYTVDDWQSRAAYDAFRAEHAEAFEAIDRRCAELTADERLLGEHESEPEPAPPADPRDRPVVGRPAPPPRLYSDLVDLWPFVSPADSYTEEVATFRERFRRHGIEDGARVLHLGSGGGSIDWHLKQSYRVTGVDKSAAMRGLAAALNPEVEYLEGDIRSARLDRTFDAVLLHDAISYLTTVGELELAYRTAAAHLEPGGIMVTLPEELPHRIAPDRVDVDTSTIDGRTVTVLEYDHDANPRDNVFETVFIFIIRERAAVQVEVDRHRGGVFPLDEFLGAIRRAGFSADAEPWELSDWRPGEEMPLVTAVLR